MSFDYPRSELSITKGQDFYRIRAPLSIVFATKVDGPQLFSIGDLAPVDSPVSAIAVGPDSDAFRYEVIYPDQLAVGQINTALLTPINPLFVATTGVETANVYPDTQQTKQIFIRVLDWLPQNGQVDLPVIDLIVYTKQPPPVYPMRRNPKRFSLATELRVGTEVLNLPISGRQQASVRFRRGPGLAAATISWEIRASKVFGYENGSPQNTEVFYQLLASTPVVGGTPQPFADGLFTYEADTHGYYDRLQVRLTSDTAHDPSSSDIAFLDAMLDIEVRD